jgi:hypothetical protein
MKLVIPANLGSVFIELVNGCVKTPMIGLSLIDFPLKLTENSLVTSLRLYLFLSKSCSTVEAEVYINNVDNRHRPTLIKEDFFISKINYYY